MYRILAVVMGFVLLLTGCVPESESVKNGIHLREMLLEGDSCSFQARIHADFDDSSYDFAVSCETDKTGGLRFSVLEPDLISGISGIIDQQSGKITFDDAILSFPLLAEGMIPPVCGPWVFYKALTGGYIKACGEEDGLYRLTINDSFQMENICVEIWLKEYTPVYAEILWQGSNILSIRISNFEIV